MRLTGIGLGGKISVSQRYTGPQFSVCQIVSLKILSIYVLRNTVSKGYESVFSKFSCPYVWKSLVETALFIWRCLRNSVIPIVNLQERKGKYYILFVYLLFVFPVVLDCGKFYPKAFGETSDHGIHFGNVG